MSSQWNLFQRQHKGQKIDQKELARMYRAANPTLKASKRKPCPPGEYRKCVPYKTTSKAVPVKLVEVVAAKPTRQKVAIKERVRGKGRATYYLM